LSSPIVLEANRNSSIGGYSSKDDIWRHLIREDLAAVNVTRTYTLAASNIAILLSCCSFCTRGLRAAGPTAPVSRSLTNFEILSAPRCVLTVTVGEIPIPTIVLALSFNLWCGETTTACNSEKTFRLFSDRCACPPPIRPTTTRSLSANGRAGKVICGSGKNSDSN
jgi:hypothetical protein